MATESKTSSKKHIIEHPFGKGDHGIQANKPEPDKIKVEREEWANDNYDRDIYKQCIGCRDVYSYGIEIMCGQGGGREYNSQHIWSIYVEGCATVTCWSCLAAMAETQRNDLKLAEEASKAVKEKEMELRFQQRWNRPCGLCNNLNIAKSDKYKVFCERCRQKLLALT